MSEGGLSRLDMWLQKVLWETEFPHPHIETEKEPDPVFQIHRLKGLIYLESGEIKMIQGVREVFEIGETKKTANDAMQAQHQSKMVLIGKGLEGLPWEDSLKSFVFLDRLAHDLKQD